MYKCIRWNQGYWVRKQEECDEEPKESLHEPLSLHELIVNELIYWQLTIEIDINILLED